jgi:uncharacterized protein (DUF952 family)
VGFEEEAEYLDAALGDMVALAVRAGRHLNVRPHGKGTNSVGALVVHCCAVCEFWLGHVALGREDRRDRDAEFAARTQLVHLEAAIERTRRRSSQDLAALAVTPGRPSELRVQLPAGGSDRALVLHVLRELHQHLGHMELTIDALRAQGRLDEPLFHLALRGDWESALASAERRYEVSTSGRTLAEVGFIHCSFQEQVVATAARFYGGRDDVVVLRIDPARLGSVVRVENLDGGEEQFPHLYGPLPVDAVVSVERLGERP